ncbi:MAG: glycerophosphodiester phosphodiesterase family protein [Chloroflexota bacterium]
MKWQDFPTERKIRGKPFVVSHRGSNKEAPENTLRAFDLALNQGAFALETDLRFTYDDEIVLLHDETLDRTTNGSGYVRDHSLSELKQLRNREPLGDRHRNQLSMETIPTLSDLIEQTHAQIPLLLELKDPLFQDRRYATQFVETLNAHNMLSQCAIISFQSKHIGTVKEIAPEIPCGQITLTNPWPKRGAELLGPLFPLVYVNPLYVKIAHRWGGVVCPLDTVPEKRMGYYQWLDVDAVLADDVKAAIKAMVSSS